MIRLPSSSFFGVTVAPNAVGEGEADDSLPLFLEGGLGRGG